MSLYLACFILLLYRGQKGQSSLRELLQPLVEGVLNDKNLSINTHPLEVYKAWINQRESETGQARYSLTSSSNCKDCLSEKHQKITVNTFGATGAFCVWVDVLRI